MKYPIASRTRPTRRVHTRCCRILLPVLALALGCLITAHRVRAQSFTVDRFSAGLPGTDLYARTSTSGPAPQHVFNNVNPPGPVPPGVGFSGDNFDDLINPNYPDRDAITAGYEPLDSPMLWDFIFSVDRGDRGLPGSSVNARATAGNAVGSDLYYANPGLGPGTNRLLSVNDVHHGLSNGPVSQQEFRDNIDGAEVFDSRVGVEIPYEGFSFLGDFILDSVNVPGGVANAYINLNGNPIFAPHELGLSEEDNIDALAMDYGFEEHGQGDQKFEVLFSLAPNSPTLAGPDGAPNTADDLSPADIFYTDLSGAFDIAGPTGLLGKFPANLNFPFDLTARNLGLRFFPQDNIMDNVDAIDIIETMTIYDLPEDPGDTPAIPAGPANPLGDFSQNGHWGPEDLGLWEGGFGKVGGAVLSDGDGDGDGSVGGKDFLIWQRKFAGRLPAIPTMAVPEPSGLVLAVLAVVGVRYRKGTWGIRIA
jgi:hypothetical protein